MPQVDIGGQLGQGHRFSGDVTGEGQAGVGGLDPVGQRRHHPVLDGHGADSDPGQRQDLAHLRVGVIAGSLASVDPEAVESVQVAPRALWPEQQIGEPDTARMLVTASRPGDDERRRAAGHHRGEDDGRQVSGVVGVGVRDEDCLQFGRVDPRLT